MLAFNHVAGGIALTSIVMSTQNINLYEKPELLGLTIFASLLPDIDTPQSLLGKIFFFISKRISISYGHRTITHSVFCLASLTACIWWASPIHAQIFGTAYGSHIFFDLLTKQGVKIFYPFSKIVAVLPANPKFRISSGDYKAEFVVFLAFIGIIFSTSELIAKGFSTYYNTTFKTFRHLHEENSKRKGILEIDFVRNGNKANALVIETTATNATISTGDSILQIDKSNSTILEIKNTGLTPSISEANASKISYDSLVNLLKINKLILELEINSNQDFIYFENGLERSGKSLKTKLTKSPLILKASHTVPPDNSLKIKELQLKINKENEKKLQSEKQKASIFLELNELASKEFSDFYEREKATKKIQELKKQYENIEIYKPDNQLFILELQGLKITVEEQNFNIYIKSWKKNF